MSTGLKADQANLDEAELRELAAVVDDLLAGSGRANGDRQAERIDTVLWDLLVQNGFAYIGIPESAGGSGGGLRESAVVLRAVGRHAAAVPLAEAALSGWLLAAGGQAIGAGLATSAAGDLSAVADGGVTVTGRLGRVAAGRDAVSVVAVARSGPDADELVVSVPVDVCKVIEGHNLAGEARDDFVIDTVPASAATRAPAGVATELRLRGALYRAVLSAGAMTGLVSQTSRYVQERHQFGRPLAAFQAVQQNIALLAGEAAAAEAAADAAVRICAASGFDSAAAELAVAAAKVRAAQAATSGTAIAHQLHGAIGFTQEHPLRDYTTRLWSWRSEWGGEKAWADRLGRGALAEGSAELWVALTGA